MTTKKSLSATQKALSALSASSAACSFCAKRHECRKTCGVMFGGCSADYVLDLDRLSAAIALAKRVNDFSREWNVWDYDDARYEVGGVAAMIADTAEMLVNGDRGIEGWLEECLDESTDYGETEPDETGKRAVRLLRDVRVFCADRN